MLIPALVNAIAANEHLPGFCGTMRAVPVDLGTPLETVAREREKAAIQGQWPSEPVRLASDAVHLVYGSAADGSLPDWAGQRVALVAHWSADGRVAPYVRRYLGALGELGYLPVLTGGCPLVVDAELRAQCAAIVYRTIPGYDFTSWKAAFAAMPSLWTANEVLCTNDSVFGPITPLKPIHTAMDAVPCDVWGLVESREKRPHLQSYYLVFRERALRHPALRTFMDAVDLASDKMSVVLRYEVALSPWLALHGLRPGVWVPAASLPRGNFNPAQYLWRTLLERFDFPFIKRDLLRTCARHPHLAGWEHCLSSRGYDPDLIRETLQDC